MAKKIESPKDGPIDLSDAAFERHCQWYEENLKIIDKKAGLVPLKLNPIQRVLERRKWELLLQKKPIRFIILKARQEGVSTWAAATMFHDAREMSNRRSMVIAHDERATKNIFQMTRRYHRFLPDEVKTKALSSTSLVFEDNDSEFIVQTAGTGDRAGRSFTCHAVHFSELDFYQEPDAVFSGVMHTIPDSYPSVLMIESTANGPNLQMQKLWDRAVEGRISFEPFFFPWFADEKYSKEVTHEDLLRYSPREFLLKNRQSVLASYRRFAPKEFKNGLGGSRGPWASAGSTDGGEGGGTPAQANPENAGKEDQGAQRKHEEDQGGERLRQEDGRKGHRAGGSVPGVPSGRKDDMGRGGPAPPPIPRELRAVFGNREDERWREVARASGGGDPEPTGKKGRFERNVFVKEDLFLQSLTPYELGLKAEFDLSDAQINWLRHCLETRCHGEETTRRREYPSRPEEAFEASGADILDPYVIAKWTKEAKSSVSLGLYRMDVTENRVGPPTVIPAEDQQGKIQIFELPDSKNSFVMAVDPSQGVANSDWIVAYVMNIQTGKQAAEYRATVDPDIAIGQIEALGIYFNNAFTGVEVNGGYGWPFVRHLEDRGTLPMYEREVWDRRTKELSMRPGWDTNVKTRPLIFAEMKETVRKERCQIMSEMTLMECSTLWENDVGKIEARPGCHDDGPMAYGIALKLRNFKLGMEVEREKKEREENSFVRNLNKRLRLRERKENHRIPSVRLPVKTTVVRGAPTSVDGRRSWL